MSVETDINKRWEEDIPHHPKSQMVYHGIAQLDWEHGGDFFCFKSGGDGDNGEHLMYLMDIYFETMEEIERKQKDEYDNSWWRGYKKGFEDGQR